MNRIRSACSFLVAGLLVAGGFALGYRWTSPPSAKPSARFHDSSPTNPANHATEGAAMRAESSPAGAVARRESHSTPQELVARLAALNVSPQAPQQVRALLISLERLREAGTAALPAIREFLASGRDVDYDAVAAPRIRNGVVPADFSVPPSLRLGMLEVLKNIGGPEAEAILLHELRTTGRGIEAAYLGTVLQQISQERYRDAALSAARDLLAMPLNTRAPNALDRSDRDYLYGVLATAGDTSQVSQAQSQLLLPNGQIDQGALRYLKQMLGEEVVGVATRAWQNPQVDPQQREPLARVALAYVGVNDAAEQLYRQAIEDPALSPNARKNLIEDLNEAGFADPRHPTLAELKLIEKRLALIEQLAPRTRDRTNAAAFVEARKDLLDMRDALLAGRSAKK
jgi:hypothetical protein